MVGEILYSDLLQNYYATYPVNNSGRCSIVTGASRADVKRQLATLIPERQIRLPYSD